MSLVRRLGDDEDKLATILNISESMVWRLKKAKIQKVERYILLLEDYLGVKGTQTLDGVLYDLKIWSNESIELREMLISLHRIMQESAKI